MLGWKLHLWNWLALGIVQHQGVLDYVVNRKVHTNTLRIHMLPFSLSLETQLPLNQARINGVNVITCMILLKCLVVSNQASYLWVVCARGNDSYAKSKITQESEKLACLDVVCAVGGLPNNYPHQTGYLLYEFISVQFKGFSRLPWWFYLWSNAPKDPLFHTLSFLGLLSLTFTGR